MAGRVVAFGVFVGSLASGAHAQTASPDVVEIPTIEVVATSPVGAGDDVAKVPANAQSVGAQAFEKQGAGTAARALDQRIGSVGINETSGNSFQPSLTYRGFEASPISGTPQGLAVYQNGVRVNEAFGDNVNWDLIPSIAIDRADIGGNNPAFGLNALGGAIALKMKNGFGYQGFEIAGEGGSYGWFSGSAQFGNQIGDYATYLAVEGARDGGFRQRSASDIRRFYGDIGVKVDSGEVHLNIGYASNYFGASAAAPIELLQQNWSAVYTTPQTSANQMLMANLTGSFKLAPTWTFDGNVYVRGFAQHTVDGNTTNVQPCAVPGLLCFGDGVTPANGLDRNQLADFSGGAQLGEIDRTRTLTTTVGGSAQMTNTDTIADHGNQLRIGASLDYSNTRFTATSELGIINPDFSVTGAGVFVGPSGAPVSIGPVSLNATTTYFGAWIGDTFDITSQLSATIGGRFNAANIALDDNLGGALNGSNAFQRFNPMVGLTYKITPELSAYAGYSEANRAPTPLELGCANPNQPCLIANFLVSDPPLKQVVARTTEAGLRGAFEAPGAIGHLDWKAGLFRTDTADDIMNVPSNIQGFGYFTNVGRTRRQGVEIDLNLQHERFNAYLAYTYLDATFLDSLTLASPNNPFADANGNIQVVPGNRIPMIPRHRLKAGVEVSVTDAFKVNVDAIVVGPQPYNGDAANLNPPLPGYGVVNAGANYKFNKNFELYGRIDNLLDRRYATFGTYFDTNQIGFAAFTDPRTLSPARPRTFVVGARATF